MTCNFQIAKRSDSSSDGDTDIGRKWKQIASVKGCNADLRVNEAGHWRTPRVAMGGEGVDVLFIAGLQHQHPSARAGSLICYRPSVNLSKQDKWSETMLRRVSTVFTLYIFSLNSHGKL